MENRTALAAVQAIAPGLALTDAKNLARRIVYGLDRGTVFIITTAQGKRERMTAKRIEHLARALPSLAPHHSPAEHARAASRIVADIGGAA